MEWAPPCHMRRAVRASGYRGNAKGVITVLVVDVILGVAVLVFLIYRQLSVRPVNASALRLIAVLLVIGLLQTYRFLSQNHAHPLTFAALGGSLVLAALRRASRRHHPGLAGRRAGVVPGQLADRGLVDRLPGRAPGLRHPGRTRERHPGPWSRHHRSVPGHQPRLPAGLGDAACPQAAARRTCCSGRAGAAPAKGHCAAVPGLGWPTAGPLATGQMRQAVAR